MNSSAPAVAATADFVAEHLADTAQNRRLIDSFSAGKNAKGLEVYLKTCALADEAANESRTYLVKDSVTGELACYFSLRACLIPLPRSSPRNGCASTRFRNRSFSTTIGRTSASRGYRPRRSPSSTAMSNRNTTRTASLCTSRCRSTSHRKSGVVHQSRRKTKARRSPAGLRVCCLELAPPTPCGASGACPDRADP